MGAITDVFNDALALLSGDAPKQAILPDGSPMDVLADRARTEIVPTEYGAPNYVRTITLHARPDAPAEEGMVVTHDGCKWLVRSVTPEDILGETVGLAVYCTKVEGE